MKQNHKYRVSIYLGKELYEELSSFSKVMGISIPTICKILLNTGKEIANNLEKGSKNNGNK